MLHTDVLRRLVLAGKTLSELVKLGKMLSGLLWDRQAKWIDYSEAKRQNYVVVVGQRRVFSVNGQKSSKIESSEFRNVSAEHGLEGGEGETSADESSGKICVWYPDVEGTTSQTITSDNGDVTVTAPTMHPVRGGKERTAMAASLPAAREFAVRQEDIPGTCSIE